MEIEFLIVLGILSFAPVHKRKEKKTENKEPEPEKPEETESEKLKRELQYTT
jgi:hypothetical protein